MSTLKFTPGPWSNVDFVLRNEIRTLKNPLIAVVQPRHCNSREELRANAHLIAAAPDLYAALEYCVKQIPDFGDVPGIKAALAKARGENLA